VFGLTAGFLVVEAGVGLWTGSLSLLADALHMLVDAGGLLLSLLAVWFAERPATPAKTYGYYRVEILAALVNGVLLCVMAIGIALLSVISGLIAAYYLRLAAGGAVVLVALLLFAAASLARRRLPPSTREVHP